MREGTFLLAPSADIINVAQQERNRWESATTSCKKKARDHQVVTRFLLHPSEFNPARARLSPRSCSGHDSTWI